MLTITLLLTETQRNNLRYSLGTGVLADTHPLFVRLVREEVPAALPYHVLELKRNAGVLLVPGVVDSDKPAFEFAVFDERPNPRGEIIIKLKLIFAFLERVSVRSLVKRVSGIATFVKYYFVHETRGELVGAVEPEREVDSHVIEDRVLVPCLHLKRVVQVNSDVFEIDVKRDDRLLAWRNHLVAQVLEGAERQKIS